MRESRTGRRAFNSQQDQKVNMVKPLSIAISLLIAAQSTVSAEEFSTDVSINIGDVQRINTPVRLLVEMPEKFVGKRGGIIIGDRFLPAQISKPGLVSTRNFDNQGKLEVTLLLANVPPGRSSGGKLLVNDEADAPAKLEFRDEAGKYTDISIEGRNVLRYMYEALDNSTKERRMETYKVYHHLYDPTGSKFVTKGAGGLFPHHRGLFFGFNRISYGDGKTADIWHCNNGESQAHAKVISEESGPLFGRHTLQIEWKGKDGAVFAVETREMTAYNAKGGVMVEFATKLESKVGELKLDGDPQHAGFQFRGSQHIPDKTKDQTYYVRPDGKGEPGKFRNWPNDKEHVNLAWHAQSFVIDETRYTCCYLDRPDNPKEARFSERDYGRFGSYFEYIVSESNPLHLNYRIWLQEGEMTVEQVDRYSKDFVSPPEVTQ